MAEKVEGDLVMLEPMIADDKNNIVNIDSNWVYPFANLDVGDVFLWNFTPYMKIGTVAKRWIGNISTEFEVNAVSLLNGNCMSFEKTQMIILIENPWKDYVAPHYPQGLYSED